MNEIAVQIERGCTSHYLVLSASATSGSSGNRGYWRRLAMKNCRGFWQCRAGQITAGLIRSAEHADRQTAGDHQRVSESGDDRGGTGSDAGNAAPGSHRGKPRCSMDRRRQHRWWRVWMCRSFASASQKWWALLGRYPQLTISLLSEMANRMRRAKERSLRWRCRTSRAVCKMLIRLAARRAQPRSPRRTACAASSDPARAGEHGRCHPRIGSRCLTTLARKGPAVCQGRSMLPDWCCLCDAICRARAQRSAASIAAGQISRYRGLTHWNTDRAPGRFFPPNTCRSSTSPRRVLGQNLNTGDADAPETGAFQTAGNVTP